METMKIKDLFSSIKAIGVENLVEGISKMNQE
jgi:hypothetical protein